MNNHAVYGEVISKVPAPELIEGGYIIPPKVTARTMPLVINSVEERDCKMILDILKSESDMDKVMVAAKSTKNINNLVTRTKFVPMCNLMGYDVLWITSKYGAFINGDKVARDKFFDTMNEWGADPDRKFIMFHHSILAEGINVSGLTACILMRNLDYVTMAQTIGRVIRLNKQDASNIANGTLTPVISVSIVNHLVRCLCQCMPTSVFLHTNVFSRLLTLSLQSRVMLPCPLFVNNNEVTDATDTGSCYTFCTDTQYHYCRLLSW